MEQIQEEQKNIRSLAEKVRNQITIGKINQEVKHDIDILENSKDCQTETIDNQFYLLSTLAKYYKSINHYDKAGKYSRDALRMVNDVADSSIKMVIDTYIEYAILERDYEQQSTARIELAKLLAFLDKKEYKDDYAYGLIFSHLGKISFDEENPEAGFTQMEKALKYFKAVQPVTNPVVRNTIRFLAGTYIKTENYSKALKLHEELLKAYEEDENISAGVQERMEIGQIYFYIDLKEARRQMTDTIKFITENSSEMEEEITKATLMLAEIDEHMMNFPRAITYYKRALDDLKKMYNKNHFMVVYVYSKIGTISLKINNQKQAREYLEEGLELSKDYPKIRLQFLYALGKIYSSKKEYTKAFDMFTQFMDKLKADGRRISKAYANTLQSIAYNYIEQENYETAYQYYTEALLIYEKVGNCREEKGLCSIRLAYCCENTDHNNFEKAERYYEKGFKLIEQGRNREVIEEALAAIIDYHTRIGNFEKRRKYEDKYVKLVLNQKDV
ncbi:tetratricopeptide repeat protein [Virgibacillus sp. MSP4-1]|uniref:tetratricopeptide repeat protein n=1 Tax=Virgibacillus sp. MSP4-1 TaxID=2700081 RepID=UPI0003A8CA4C|nr:tetratricopeptide repeat protein [Virgibacillus sp. MSP4-1]QHS22494.1 tetratricopeptide repeat protein [Virgibacillus sp. MSP4-1]